MIIVRAASTNRGAVLPPPVAGREPARPVLAATMTLRLALRSLPSKLVPLTWRVWAPGAMPSRYTEPAKVPSSATRRAPRNSSINSSSELVSSPRRKVVFVAACVSRSLARLFNAPKRDLRVLAAWWLSMVSGRYVIDVDPDRFEDDEWTAMLLSTMRFLLTGED